VYLGFLLESWLAPPGRKTREPLTCWQAVAGLRPLTPASADFQTSAGEVAGCQFWGNNSVSRAMECAGMRESTSWNQANGSTPQRLQEATKLRSTAAVFPPVAPMALRAVAGRARE